MLALRGKTAGFEKVIKLIDEMVALLNQEQLDDDHKKEYCEMQFDFTDDKKKELERAVSKLETAIDDAKEGIAALTADIEALNAGIVALDKSVAEATEQRKEENSDYKTLVQSDAAAKDILAFAKNRLNKFYNPKLYKPDGASFMQISSHGAKADPGPAPEAPKAFKKNAEGGTGVIAMIDTLIKDLDTEITEAETEEKLAQEEYEELMADSASKRASDSKSVTDKEGVKANTEAALAADESDSKDTKKELMATVEYEAALHAECDWLIKFFDMRKEARAGEIDSMKKAKAVLSGADFSLVQTSQARFLGRA
jgi:chromosome segregation ATPase